MGRTHFVPLLTLIWQMRLFSSILHSCVTVSDEESVVLLPSLTFLSNKAILSEEHRDLRQIFQGSNSFWGDAAAIRTEEKNVEMTSSCISHSMKMLKRRDCSIQELLNIFQSKMRKRGTHSGFYDEG